jgi:LacI family transcriptional regulator
MTSIRDVAKLAGVSPATVSRVMNGTANVDSQKRQRVEQAIKETGFKPNEVARSLYKKSSKIIGVIVPNIENPFFNELAGAIEEECDKNGYRLTLCNSNNDLEKEKRNMNLLSRMNADGIILMTNQKEIKEEVKKCQIPVIMLDRQVGTGSEIAYIQSDHYMGGRIAMEHLLECGCRHIVQMSGPNRFSSARQRFQGYSDVCRERELELVSLECEYDYEDGLKKAEELIRKYPDTDGIIAANDMVAISVYKVLTKKGYRIPEDIQLIGFDNINLSRLFTPEITTIEQPITRMGQEAVKVLIAYIEGREFKRQNVFPVTLIPRETTIKKRIKEKEQAE